MEERQAAGIITTRVLLHAGDPDREAQLQNRLAGRIPVATRVCLTARAVGSGGCQLLDVGGRVVRRHELTDQAWAEIAPLLPPTGRPGGQWADHRRVVNGILWKLATGVPWRDLPERYGPWQTC
jgi:hypothetical protein